MIYNFNELTNRLNYLKFNEFLKDWQLKDICSEGENTVKTEIINGEEVKTSITKTTIIGKRYRKTLETNNGWDRNVCTFECYNDGKTILSIINYNRDGSNDFKIDKPITTPQEFIKEFEDIFMNNLKWCHVEDYIDSLKNRLN